MKIVYAGIFIDHELGGDLILEKGLKENNCTIYPFDYRSISNSLGKEEMSEMLIDLCKGKDALFVGKGEIFSKRTFSKIRAMGVIVVLWYGDIRLPPDDWLIDLLSSVDFFFMTSGGDVLKQYHQKGKPKLSAYFLNPSDQKLQKKYNGSMVKEIDILFTGSAYEFAEKERRETVQYLMKRNDVTTFGGIHRMVMSEYRITNFLKGFKIQGKNDERIRGEEYINTIRKTKVGVGVSAFQNIQKYTSDRLIHYLTFGTFYLPWYFPGLEELFDEDEIISFKSINDLNEKLSYYLNNEEERESIAQKGMYKVLNDYNCVKMTKMMLEIIQKETSNMYPWVEILKN